MAAVRRRLAGLVAATALGLLAVILAGLSSPASAHAYLETSNPADGTTLTTSPGELRLGFSEHVVESATRIRVQDGHGRVVTLTGVRISSADATDTEVPSTAVARLPRLTTGAYRVSWETLSSDDLHRTSGYFAFGVGQTVVASASTEQAPDASEAAARSGLLLALALVLGGLLAARVLRRAGSEETLPRRLTAAGVLATCVMSVVLLVDQVVRSGTGFETVVLSAYGARWALRAAGVLVIGLAVWRRTPPVHRRWLLPLGIVAAALGTASLGHAGAGQLSPTRLLADAAHVVATLSWGGAVLCLALVLLLRRGRREDAHLRAALRAFAWPATVCLGVAVVTGVYLASSTVASVDAALLSIYGRTLLLKLLAVAAAGLLGLASHVRLRRRPSGTVRRLPVPFEALGLLAVLLLTAVLTSAQPATGPRYVDLPSRADTAPVDRQVADLQVVAEVQPNLVGESAVAVDVYDTRRPAPAPITGVEASVGSGRPVTLQPDGSHWSAPYDVNDSGRTSLVVVVHRAGMADTTAQFTWRVGELPRAHPPTTVSRAPLGGPLRAIALAGGSVFLAGLSLALWRRRPRRVRLSAAPPGLDPSEASEAAGASTHGDHQLTRL